MPNINKVTIAGHLGKDPELRHTQNQKAVATLSIATSEKRKDQEAETEWHRVTLWGKNAESFCEKYRKGDVAVVFEGKLKTRSWDDKDGNKRYSTEIHTFYVMGRKKEDQAQQADNEEIPF